MIYTDSLSFKQSIKFNKENHPILNQIFDMLAELKNQGKHIILRKVPVHMGIEKNEAVKEAIFMLGMATQEYLVKIISLL